MNNDDIAKISSLLDTKLKPIKQNISGIKKDVTVMKQDVSALKTDVSGLKTDVHVLKTDVKGLKKDIHVLNTDVQGLKKDIHVLNTDVQGLKKDVKDLKSSSKLTLEAVINILDWTQDIHESIVMKKLPERVDKLEQVFKTS